MKVLPFARQQRAARARRQIAEMNAARKERLMNPPAMPLLLEPPKMETLTVEPMTKREFMQQYVLNRALTVDDMSGRGSAEQAEIAWDVIEKGCAK